VNGGRPVRSFRQNDPYAPKVSLRIVRLKCEKLRGHVMRTSAQRTRKGFWRQRPGKSKIGKL